MHTFASIDSEKTASDRVPENASKHIFMHLITVSRKKIKKIAN